MSTPGTAPYGRGAWGLRIEGLDAMTILVDAEAGWPEIGVQVVPLEVGEEDEAEWTSSDARFALLGGGFVRMKRDPLAVVLALPVRPADECVVQPHLASVAANASQWLGRQAFHAGAFVVNGGAWLLLGAKEDGKSSTLGWLGLNDVTVLTDDLAVCSDGAVFAGPRCVDLRPEAAGRLCAGRDLGVVGTRQRWRLDLPACPVSVPLRGFVFARWGEEPTIEAMTGADRLSSLVAHRALRLPWISGDALLDLAAYRSYRWTRRRSWDEMETSVNRLLDTLESK